MKWPPLRRPTSGGGSAVATRRRRRRCCAVSVVLPCPTAALPRILSKCRQLYEVLSQPALAKRRVPVLLACNKQVQRQGPGLGGLGGAVHCVGALIACRPRPRFAPALRPCASPCRRATAALLRTQDMGSKAHTVEFVRKRLEKELDQLRSTRGALSDVGGGGGGGGVQLGTPGEPFTFESHARARGVKVTTATLSAVDKGGCAEVEAFIRRCVPA